MFKPKLYLLAVALVPLLCQPACASMFEKPVIQAGNATIEIAFSPDMGATGLVVKAINEAQKTIRVAAYSFTSKPIAEALMNAHKRGIDVQVVVDKSQAKAKYTSATFLANVGIPTRVDYKYAIMHNKFIIIDDSTTELGSFNYTSAAEKKNAENVMVIRGNKEVASRYMQEWDRLWGESETYQPRY